MENTIRKFEEAGAKRWTKGNFDRLYLDAEVLGYTCDRYKTGNVKSAELNGESISNSEMNRVLSAKTFLDINDNFKIHTTYNKDKYIDVVNDFVESIMA